jgi:hypothetical protein
MQSFRRLSALIQLKSGWTFCPRIQRHFDEVWHVLLQKAFLISLADVPTVEPSVELDQPRWVDVLGNAFPPPMLHSRPRLCLVTSLLVVEFCWQNTTVGHTQLLRALTSQWNDEDRSSLATYREDHEGSDSRLGQNLGNGQQKCEQTGNTRNFEQRALNCLFRNRCLWSCAGDEQTP